ncbi:MAG: histone deacetylase [Pseudomonadota bacterium]
MTTGFHYDPIYLAHQPGRGHPERPERLEAAIAHLQAQTWFDQMPAVRAAPASLDWVYTIHAPDYVARAQAACAAGQAHLDVPDVGISTASYDVALAGCGAGLALADAVVSGTVDNAFGLIRPPGHHAETSLALGFCLFNNVAIMARYLQQQYGFEKVLILDWDVHHGNGTQHSFENDASVMYISLHQYPFYPGTGAHSESGEGAGRGATVNCPMPAGATDAHYQAAFTERVLPAIDNFAPEVVILSAGFDAHANDPLAQVDLTTSCYAWMTLRMLEVADKHAGGRLISILEGGYDLRALSESVALHVETLLHGGTSSTPAES